MNLLPLEIKVLDHIIAVDTSYTSMAEKDYLSYQCKDAAIYAAIILDEASVKEKQSRFQYAR